MGAFSMNAGTPEARSSRGRVMRSYSAGGLTQYEKSTSSVMLPVRMEIRMIDGKRTFVGVCNRDIYPTKPGEKAPLPQEYTDPKEFANKVSSMIVDLAAKL